MNEILSSMSYVFLCFILIMWLYFQTLFIDSPCLPKKILWQRHHTPDVTNEKIYSGLLYFKKYMTLLLFKRPLLANVIDDIV